MSDKSLLLTSTLLKQNEILGELLSIIVKQRDALKEGRLADLQDLMSELRHASVRCQAIETKRMRATEDLAGALGCEAVVSSILPMLSPEEAASVEPAAKALGQTVQKIKVEMSILARLMEEAKLLNQMLITEWQKLSAKAFGGATVVFDARI